MIEYLKPKIAKNFQIVGNLSQGSVPICSFNNNAMNPFNYSSLEVLSENGTVVEKDVVEFRTLETNAFQDVIEYNKDDFIGKLNLETITKEEFFKKEYVYVTMKKEIISQSSSEIEKTIDYIDDNSKGTLSIQKIDIKSVDVKEDGTSSYSMTIPFCIQQSNYSYIELNGYSGNISVDKTIFSAMSRNPSIKVFKKESGKVNGSFPSQIIENGIVFLPTGDFTDEVIDTWVKHYGFCRYWGGGGSSSNNYYGDPDSRFRVHGWTAKGFMNDSLPAPTLQRWGHLKNIEGKHNPEKYPIDNGGYWDYKVGEPGGILWCYDVEEAMKYGGANSNLSGGAVWASTYFKNSGGVFPPKGYSSDYTGSSHYPMKNGSSSPIDHRGAIIIKDGAQKTKLAGYYNVGGFYCKWFRDVILFYKGKTSKRVSIAKYEGCIVESNGVAKEPVSSSSGFLKKNVIESFGTVSGITATVTYGGIVEKITKNLEYKAKYKGTVRKKMFVSNVIPKPKEAEIMTVGSLGYLEGNSLDVGSVYIEITNFAKDGEPLYYSYKLENEIFIAKNITSETVLDNLYVAIDYDNLIVNNIKSLIRVKPTGKKNLYSCELILNKNIGSNDFVYIEYITTGEQTTRELLYTSLLYNQGIDFKLESFDEICMKTKVGTYSFSSDRRRPVAVSFKVKTTDGSFESNAHSTILYNERYAYESERVNFIGKKMKLTDKTVKSILALDVGVEEEVLVDKKFFLEVVTSSDIVDLFCEPDGNSFAYGLTFADTGEPVVVNGATEYTGIIEKYNVKVVKNGNVLNGFYVRNLLEQGVEIKKPTFYNKFLSQFINISCYQFKLLDAVNGKQEAVFKMGDYFSQSFDTKLGFPYIKKEYNVDISGRTIKLLDNKVLWNKDYIKISDGNYIYKIESFDSKDSTITLCENVSDVSSLKVSYMKKELSIEYSGYDNFDLDLNQNYLHSYIDPKTAREYPSYNLFGKCVYIFLRPDYVKKSGDEFLITDTNDIITDQLGNTYITNNYIVNNEGESLIYHKIEDSKANNEFDILIGVVQITPISSILNTEIKQNTVIGGGLLPKYIKKNKDIGLGFYDILSYSDKVFKNSGTVVFDKYNSLLDVVSKGEFERIIDLHMPTGILPVVIEEE